MKNRGWEPLKKLKEDGGSPWGVGVVSFGKKSFERGVALKKKRKTPARFERFFFKRKTTSSF